MQASICKHTQGHEKKPSERRKTETEDISVKCKLVILRFQWTIKSVLGLGLGLERTSQTPLTTRHLLGSIDNLHRPVDGCCVVIDEK